MNFNYEGLNVYYDMFGQGKRLVLLHGWGGPNVWFPYIDKLVQDKFQVFLIHLPGFGNSSIPTQTLNSYKYSEIVVSLVKSLEMENCVLMGHSLGGKIATICNSKYKIGSKLILVDSAGFRRFYIDVWTKKNIAHTGKLILKHFGQFGEKILESRVLLKILGSVDYIDSGKMKNTLKLVVEEDIRTEFSKVKSKTLILWGENDKATPLIDGVEINRRIHDSKIFIFKYADHFPFICYPKLFFNIINNFVNE